MRHIARKITQKLGSPKLYYGLTIFATGMGAIVLTSAVRHTLGV